MEAYCLAALLTAGCESPQEPKPLEPPTGFILLTDTTRNPHGLSLAALADGGYAAAWKEGSAFSMRPIIRGRRFDSAGGLVEAWTGTTSGPFHVDIRPYPEGGYIAVWHGGLDLSETQGCYAWRDSETRWGEPRLLVPDSSRYEGYPVSVLPRSEGGFLLAYVQYGSGTLTVSSLRVERFDREGVSLGTALRLDRTPSDSSYLVYPKLAALPDGGWMALWEERRDIPPDTAWLATQRFDAMGVPSGSPLVLETPGWHRHRFYRATALPLSPHKVLISTPQETLGYLLDWPSRALEPVDLPLTAEGMNAMRFNDGILFTGTRNLELLDGNLVPAASRPMEHALQVQAQIGLNGGELLMGGSLYRKAPDPLPGIRLYRWKPF